MTAPTFWPLPTPDDPVDTDVFFAVHFPVEEPDCVSGGGGAVVADDPDPCHAPLEVVHRSDREPVSGKCSSEQIQAFGGQLVVLLAGGIEESGQPDPAR